MTWKERQLISILSAILAVLTAAVLVVLGVRYRQSRQAAEAAEAAVAGAIITDQHTYTALTYDNGSATLSFALDENGRWQWSDIPDFPLDDTVVSSILDQLSGLKPQQTLAAEEGETYGLDDPAAALTASTGDGTALTLTLGRATTDGTSRYLRMNDDETTVYIIADTLYQTLKTPIYDMMLLPELPQLDPDRIDSIFIQGPAGEEGVPAVQTVLVASRDESGTHWRAVGQDITGDETLEALLEDISALHLEKCLDYRPSAEAAEICGLTQPQAVLTVRATTEDGAEQALKLTVGVGVPEGTGRYVRVGEDEPIYLLPTAALDPLMRVAANGLTD